MSASSQQASELEPLLAVRGLATLVGGNHHPSVDLDVAAGECLAVRGVSGSGKTLFLRALADLDPNVGTAALASQDRAAMSAPEWRAQVCYVAATAGWWGFTVADHFDDVQQTQLGPLLAALELPVEIAARQLDGLSSGERQRLALIRALVHRPQVLLLDEPTAFLDAGSRSRVEEMLTGFMDEGGAIIMVTHDEAQARRLARRQLSFTTDNIVEEAL